MPVHRRAPGIVDFADLGEQVPVVRQEVNQVDGRAQKIAVESPVVRSPVVQVILTERNLLLDTVLAVARHRSEEPKAQLRQERLVPPQRKDIPVRLRIENILRLHARYPQQRQTPVRRGIILMQERLRQQEHRQTLLLRRHEKIPDMLDIPSGIAFQHRHNVPGGFLIDNRIENRLVRVIVSFEVDEHGRRKLLFLFLLYGSKAQILGHENFQEFGRGIVSILFLVVAPLAI